MTTHDISRTLGRDDVYVVSTRDGSDTLFSREHNATYHSVYGAVAESKHVFVEHGLKMFSTHSRIAVLEFGFGTGLNAFLAYLYALVNEKKVDYTGIEPYPLDISVAHQLDYPHYLAFPEERDIFERMHSESALTAGPFSFRKFPSYQSLPATDQYDCIFFDAFAPGAQPELWDQAIFDLLFAITNPGGCLVTYCAQGEARRRMSQAGYEVQRLAGPPGKREMLRALKP